MLLIRDGARLAHGPAREVVTRAALATLYNAEIREVIGAGERAFLP